MSPSIPPATCNKIAERWKKKIQQHQAKKCIIGNDDNKLRQGVMTGTITSTIVDSGATSGVGTTTDPCQRTGRQSTKQFILPSGAIVPATKIAEYHSPFDPPPTNSTSPPASVSIPFLARASTPMLITSLFLTRTLSTFTTPTTRRSQ